MPSPPAHNAGLDPAINRDRRPALQIALLYVIAGSLWIVGSDWLVNSLFGGTEYAHSAQTWKGPFYIAATTGLIYWLVAGALTKARESEHRYRLLFDNNPLPLWVYDLDTLTFLAVNDAAVRAYGYSREEFLAMRITDIRPPEDVAPLQAALEHVEPTQFQSGIWRHRLRDGSEIRVRVSTHGTVFGDREARLVLALDVTDQLRAEAALRDSEQRFRYVAQASVDAAWDWDIDTDRIWWSGGLARLFGYDAPELQADLQWWLTRVREDERPAVELALQEALASGGSDWEYHYHFRRADGSEALVLDRGFIIRDEAGKAVRMVGGMSDITERVALEEQVRQTQRLEAIGQLTGGIAHDFNNLLTVILGNGEVLCEELAQDSRKRQLAKMVVMAAHRGSELTQRLLAYARRQALAPKAVDVNALIAHTRDLLARTLEAEVEVLLEPAPDLWRARVDPGQLENAVLNLAINARDAMDGDGRITIRTRNAGVKETDAARRPDAEAGDYVLLSVSDTGCGIPPEHLPRLFEPFFTTKGTGRGTGLGLAMVYGFVRQSGGHVRVASEPGHGTTITLYLPRAGSDDSQAAADEHEPAVAGGKHLERILVVEDDPMVRQHAVATLRGLGYEVLEAPDGDTAMTLLEGDTPVDLLFTDMRMPGRLNGRQLAATARAQRPGLKVLYTSGYSSDGFRQDGHGIESALLLRKPYQREQLAGIVRRALDAASARRPHE